MSSPTILIVEDNPITRKMIRITLQSQGYRVEEAEDMRSALIAAAAASPDLVVCDYLLPDGDGIHLLAELRRQAGGRELPALVVTGMTSRLEELSAGTGGPTQFLAKPVEPSRLLEIVGAHLQPHTTAGGGRRLLVVDDEPVNLKLANVLLRHEGYEVEVAEGARQGLAMARARPPDAILSDVLMPAMDGFSFCAEIRRDPRLAAIPVVLVSSSYLEAADRDLALRIGANALVTRTSDLRSAVEALRDSLRGTRQQRSPGDTEALAALHEQRLKAQLDYQTVQNRALLRQTAIQSTALSVIKSLSDILGKPTDAPAAIGEVLVQCLDAAGLSTGLLYRLEPGNRYRLHAHSGVPVEQRQDAQECFGHPEQLDWMVQAARPVALQGSQPAGPPGAGDFLRRLGCTSALGVPIQVLGESFGVLLLASDTQNLAEGSWMGFAVSLAAQFGQAIALGQSLSRLAASEERYRTLMEHANDAIVIAGLDKGIEVVNDAAVRLFGRPRGEILGRSYEDFLAAEEREEAVRARQTLLTTGRLRVGLRHFEWPDGTRVPVEVSCSLVRVGGGESAVIAILSDLTEQQRREEVLLDSAERTRLLLDSTAEAIFGIDLDGSCTFCNRACAEMLGHGGSDRLIGRNMHELMHGRRADGTPYPAEECPTHRVLAGSSSSAHVGDEVFWCADGSSFPAEYWCYPIRRGSTVVGAVVTFLDISERIAADGRLRRLEAQLLQAQKMESVGRLAGGVAHDFNNLLTLILGYGNLLLEPLAGQPELRRQLELILQAGTSAAALTRQLLAFSRRQVLVPAVLDLSALVGHLEHMLRRVIGEDVELVTDLAPDLGHVLADPGQLEQVIMNLAVNSRDAMPDGGRLTIATRNCAAGERPAALAEAGPAPAADPAGAAGQQVAALAGPAAGGGPMSHVALSISDTGAGISEAVMEHLFEPFFTTKEEGKGTGLGLATVYGIVHQSGGRIEVESQPGAGATFVIYLPRTGQAAPGAQHPDSEAQRGSETILVVEDQAEIRGLARIILEELGYEVLVAAGAEEALRIARQDGRKIDLLLTDVIMPQVSGVTLAAQLSAHQPGIRVLFMSGYTDRAVKPEEMPPGAAFLQKPFDPAALARLVREALGPRPA